MLDGKPVFSQPAHDAKLWRYMDFTKFVSLLTTQKIYFCRSDLFEDPFEGTYAQANEKYRPLAYQDDPAILASFEKDLYPALEKFRKVIFINCWHANEHESAAMWKLYAQTNEAIAIESDYSALYKLNVSPDIHIGQVAYMDYEKEWMSEGHMLVPFMTKRLSFEHEKEVRLLYWDKSYDWLMGEGEQVSGKHISVDLNLLVKKVHISPTAPSWFVELTKTLVARLGFSFEICQSKLYSTPIK